jgi:hypothetical protein
MDADGTTVESPRVKVKSDTLNYMAEENEAVASWLS